MARILGIVGSNRPVGNSEVLAKEALMSAKNRGAEINTIRLGDLDIKACKGCLKCALGGQCKTDDDMNFFLSILADADGLILSCPTYAMTPPGTLKMIIDRFFMASQDPSRYSGKKVGLISVAGSPDRSHLSVPLLSLFGLALGMEIVDYLRAFSPGSGLMLLEEEAVDRAAELGSRIVDAVNGNYDTGEQSEKNICPICKSTFFQISEEGVKCPVCAAKGSLTDGIVVWEESVKKNNLWAGDAAAVYFKKNYDIAKELFLSKRQEMTEMKQRYKDKSYDFGWIEIPGRND